MNTLKGAFFFITGLLTCPCHLPITLPILVALTAGTAFGAFLANNVWVIAALSMIYFIVALALGFRYFRQEERACEIPKPETETRIKTRAASGAHIREM